MKKLLFLFVLLSFFSCADEIEFPSVYEYASTSVDIYYPFQVENGEWVELDLDAASPPEVSVLENTASISRLEFIDDTNVKVTDGFDTEELTYNGRVSQISMMKDGQRIELKGISDGSQFEVRSVISGDFDGISQNVYISSICGDLVNCFEINPFDWLSNAGAFQDGQIQYVLIRRDVLKKV